MPEILLPTLIQSKDVPPRARGVVEIAVGKDPELLTHQIKDALYPGWWTYRNMETLPEHLRPFYRIFCENPQQALIAEQLKPQGARIEIASLEQLQGLEREIKPSYPFIEKLKNVNPRWWTATNLAISAFGAESLLAALATQSNEQASLIFTGLGIALSTSGIILMAIRSGHMPKVEISFHRTPKNQQAVEQ